MSKIEDQALEAERLHREEYPELYKDDPELDADGNPIVKEELDADGNPIVKEELDADGKPIAKVELNEDGSPKVIAPIIQTDTEDFKQKYFVLKGKYDAEVPRLNDELKELKVAVRDLQVGSVKKVEEQKDDQDIYLTDPSIVFLSKEYPEVYKALVAFDKISKKNTKPAEIDPNIEQRIAKVEETTVKTAEDRFVQDLNKNAADWAEVNRDPRFETWLNEDDPLTGYKRMDLAVAAQNSLNGKRVAAFYNGFKQAFNIVTDKNSTDTGTKDADAGKKDMSKYTAPNPSKSGAPNLKQEVDEVTREFIDKFYTESAKGLYAGREDEAAKIEAKITKALADNKIV